MRSIVATVALTLALLVLAPLRAAAAGPPPGEPAPPAPAETAPTPDGGPPAPAAPAPAEPAPADGTPAPPGATPSPAEAAPAPTEPTPAPAEATPAPAEDPLAPQRNRAMGLAIHGQELVRSGLPDQALVAFTEALAAWPAYPLALNELGVLFVRRNELARAEALLQQAVDLDPDFTSAHANLAEVQRRLGRFAPAIEHYHKVLDARPDDVDAHYGLAAAFARTGAKPAARWAMERYLALSGEDASGARIDEVKAQLERLDDADVEAAAPWAVAAAPAASTPPATEATPPIEDVQTVAEGEPGLLARHAGDAAFYARRYVAALAAYKEELAGGDDVVLLYKIGATYAVMNDFRSALRYWRQALLKAPARELIVRHLGLATMKLAAQAAPATSELPDPLEGARVALIAGDPAHAVALLGDQPGEVAAQLRGEAQLMLGDLRGARQSFEGILAARPDDRDASGGLAEALARQGATAAADAAMRAWLGDRSVPPETFLVLRSNELGTRLTSEPEE